jgi:hypothetical protein
MTRVNRYSQRQPGPGPGGIGEPGSNLSTSCARPDADYDPGADRNVGVSNRGAKRRVIRVADMRQKALLERITDLVPDRAHGEAIGEAGSIDEIVCLKVDRRTLAGTDYPQSGTRCVEHGPGAEHCRLLVLARGSVRQRNLADPCHEPDARMNSVCLRHGRTIAPPVSGELLLAPLPALARGLSAFEPARISYYIAKKEKRHALHPVEPVVPSGQMPHERRGCLVHHNVLLKSTISVPARPLFADDSGRASFSAATECCWFDTGRKSPLAPVRADKQGLRTKPLKSRQNYSLSCKRGQSGCIGRALGPLSPPQMAGSLPPTSRLMEAQHNGPRMTNAGQKASGAAHSFHTAWANCPSPPPSNPWELGVRSNPELANPGALKG